MTAQTQKKEAPRFPDFVESCIKTNSEQRLLVPFQFPMEPETVKPSLPYPAGPNDLGIVDHTASDRRERVRELTLRVLTDRHLKGVDIYSAGVFRELFYSVAVFIVESNSHSSTWDEVLRFFDKEKSGWDNPYQIVVSFQNESCIENAISSSLLAMSDENLWIFFDRFLLVLRKAINDVCHLVGTKRPRKKGAGSRSSRKLNAPILTKYVSVFESEAIQRALATVGKMSEKIRAPAEQALKAACINDGRRALPDVRMAINNLDQLGREFENLDEPIRHLRTELVLASAMDPEEFRISPILLLGDPGIGKTYLALQLANALGVPMEKISAGSAQGGFQLTGSHPSWIQAMMGSVFQLLVEGISATPVLVVDEVDKIGSSNASPIVPTLLDLLEHNTAKAFRDEFVDMQFDASRLIVVMTANDRETIPAPLLSRVSMFDIPRPGLEQRRRIIDNEIAGLVKKTRKRVTLDKSATDELAARVDLDLRQTRRAVVEAFARGLTDREKVVVPKVPTSISGQRAMGFVR